MKLLLDIGNSRVKWAQMRDQTISGHGVCAHRQEQWVEHLPQEQPRSIWVSCVAGDLPMQQLHDWAQARWPCPINRIASTASACGLRNAYPEPSHLGVDRWMACIAGFHRGAGSVLVADAGTALTLDFVDARGAHKGGLICPGVGSMRDALLGRTQLSVPDQRYGLTWLADDTRPAVALGSLRAVLALLDNARRELVPERCLLTGGEGEELAEHLGASWQHAPHLVLEGISHFAQSE